MKRKIIYRLFSITVIISLLIWAYVEVIQKAKGIKLNNQENNGYIQTLPPKTFTDIKQETLNLILNQNNSTKINFAFIEFRMHDFKHALIIRMDSLVGIISIWEPHLSKNDLDDKVIQQSFELLNILDQHFNSLPFGINQKRIPNLKMRGMNIYIHPDEEAILQLNINRENYQKPVYSDISRRVTKLISEIYLIDISVEDLMKPMN
jgi:hypothetical protein